MMTTLIKLKHGLDIRLIGEAKKVFVTLIWENQIADKPTDFHELAPKILAKAGQEEKAGEPIFLNKNNPEILFTTR